MAEIGLQDLRKLEDSALKKVAERASVDYEDKIVSGGLTENEEKALFEEMKNMVYSQELHESDGFWKLKENNLEQVLLKGVDINTANIKPNTVILSRTATSEATPPAPEATAGEIPDDFEGKKQLLESLFGEPTPDMDKIGEVIRAALDQVSNLDEWREVFNLIEVRDVSTDLISDINTKLSEFTEEIDIEVGTFLSKIASILSSNNTISKIRGDLASIKDRGNLKAIDFKNKIIDLINKIKPGSKNAELKKILNTLENTRRNIEAFEQRWKEAEEKVRKVFELKPDLIGKAIDGDVSELPAGTINVPNNFIDPVQLKEFYDKILELGGSLKPQDLKKIKDKVVEKMMEGIDKDSDDYNVLYRRKRTELHSKFKEIPQFIPEDKPRELTQPVEQDSTLDLSRLDILDANKFREFIIKNGNDFTSKEKYQIKQRVLVELSVRSLEEQAQIIEDYIRSFIPKEYYEDLYSREKFKDARQVYEAAMPLMSTFFDIGRREGGQVVWPRVLQALRQEMPIEIADPLSQDLCRRKFEEAVEISKDTGESSGKVMELTTQFIDSIVVKMATMRSLGGYLDTGMIRGAGRLSFGNELVTNGNRVNYELLKEKYTDEMKKIYGEGLNINDEVLTEVISRNTQIIYESANREIINLLKVKKIEDDINKIKLSRWGTITKDILLPIVGKGIFVGGLSFALSPALGAIWGARYIGKEAGSLIASNFKPVIEGAAISAGVGIGALLLKFVGAEAKAATEISEQSRKIEEKKLELDQAKNEIGVAKLDAERQMRQQLRNGSRSIVLSGRGGSNELFQMVAAETDRLSRMDFNTLGTQSQYARLRKPNVI